MLGAEESWFCPKCKVSITSYTHTITPYFDKKHQRAAKKMDIWSLPPFLIIHLKRFQSVNGGWRKSQREVIFPTTDFEAAELCLLVCTPTDVTRAP